MFRNLKHAVNLVSKTNAAWITRRSQSFLLLNRRACFNPRFARFYGKKDDTTSSLFKPVPIRQTEDDINVGAEITGTALDKAELVKILNRFFQKRETRLMCMENGLDRKCLNNNLKQLSKILF